MCSAFSRIHTQTVSHAYVHMNTHTLVKKSLVHFVSCPTGMINNQHLLSVISRFVKGLFSMNVVFDKRAGLLEHFWSCPGEFCFGFPSSSTALFSSVVWSPFQVFPEPFSNISSSHSAPVLTLDLELHLCW
jgi:hypothetical protein